MSKSSQKYYDHQREFDRVNVAEMMHDIELFEYLNNISEREVWKAIPEYIDYEVSTLGRVKSLKMRNPIILKNSLNSSGYYTVALCKNKIQKTFNVHKLVAITFLNHTPCGYELVINHKNNIPTDNSVNNLEIITQRENCYSHYKGTSKFKGVYYEKSSDKWVASIRINGKLKFLGRFKNEYDAHLTYKKEVKKL